jgi:hypothetical protein
MATAEELRLARKARIAARAAAEEGKEKEKAEEASEKSETEEATSEAPPNSEEQQEEAKSAFNYNPLYSKPTHLGSDAPSGGYHYYGPPPDAGTSYGCFTAKDGTGVIMPKEWAKAAEDTSEEPSKSEDEKAESCEKRVAYHPGTGEPMKFAYELDKDGLASVLAAMDYMRPIPNTNPPLTTSAPIHQFPVMKMYHPATGDEITEQVKTMKPSTDKKTEAVKYEALSKTLPATLTEADVNGTLFAEDTVDPYWNIDIQGRPTATVHLADQPKPEETRELFVSENYFNGVAQAIARMGAAPVLKQINARFWTNEVDASELSKKIEAKYAEKYQEHINAVTDKLLHCIEIVNAGMDKNFFQDVDHPMKLSLYEVMSKYGIPANDRMQIIESAFEAGATPYFKTVFEKAVEFVGMEPTALAQVEQAIGKAGVIKPEVDASFVAESDTDLSDPSTARTLSERLARTSVAINSGFEAQDPKSSLRASLGLGGASPRRR